MRFQLLIDPEKPEMVLVRAHCRSELTNKLEEMVLQGGREDQLAVFMEDDMRLMNISDIQLILTEDGKTLAVDENGKAWRLRQRLYELEEKLPEYFIRISKSALANERHLMRFSAGFSGAVDAVFRCGRKESVSRRCFADIKRRLNGK